jgi:hypothetical protein
MLPGTVTILSHRQVKTLSMNLSPESWQTHLQTSPLLSFQHTAWRILVPTVHKLQNISHLASIPMQSTFDRGSFNKYLAYRTNMDATAPTFFRQWPHRWRWGRQPYSPANLPHFTFAKIDLVLIIVRGTVEIKAAVVMQTLGQLQNQVISSGIEPITFRLVP